MSALLEAIQESNEALAEDDVLDAYRILRNYMTSNELDLSSLPQLSEKLDVIANHRLAEEKLPLQRLAILSGNHTPGFMIKAITCTLARDGMIVKTFEGGYNAYNLEILDINSPLGAFEPHVILIGLTWHDLAIPTDPYMSQPELEAMVDENASSFTGLWEVIEQRFNVPVIQHLFDKPPYNILGAAERHLASGINSYIDAMNARLMTLAPGSLHWLDMDALSSYVGRKGWCSPRDYYTSKLPFSLKHLSEYARWFSAVYRGTQAKAKKCLVLDLDNTLWGGTIGDDGVNGIQFGAGTAKGEAHLDFCLYIKSLKERGVILAVNSKNDPDVASEVFTKREDMPLNLDDFAAFVCNWQDKPGNMKLIARELNLNVDSFVFVDDNLAECEFMRQELPEVATIALTKDASQFITHLDGARLFNANRLNITDKTRATSYHALQRANKDRQAASSLENFLASLDMVASIQKLSPQNLDRLAQMQARTNQFNLTTRRYTADQIDQAAHDGSGNWLIVSMKDRYADHGVIATLLVIQEDDTLRIDDWIMSCRVFSRTLEEFMFNQVLAFGRTKGAKRIIGEYLPTERNMPVKDLYDRLGFYAGVSSVQWWYFDIPDDGGELDTYVAS